MNGNGTHSEHAAIRRKLKQRDRTAAANAALAVQRQEKIEALEEELAAKAEAYEKLYADFDTMTQERDELREEIRKLGEASDGNAR